MQRGGLPSACLDRLPDSFEKTKNTLEEGLTTSVVSLKSQMTTHVVVVCLNIEIVFFWPW